jgi:pimeloyl-ACP methyl ester carboxylesterase
MAELAVREGVLGPGLPALTFGTGPALLVLSGLTAEHAVPTGAERKQQLRMFVPLADRFTVHVLNRRPGLPEGTTVADLATDVAVAVREDVSDAVTVVGISTGGAIALQLAADHPDLVRRLVVVCAACRLSGRGREAQRRLAELALAGRPGAGWGGLGPLLAATRPAR